MTHNWQWASFAHCAVCHAFHPRPLSGRDAVSSAPICGTLPKSSSNRTDVFATEHRKCSRCLSLISEERRQRRVQQARWQREFKRTLQAERCLLACLLQSAAEVSAVSQLCVEADFLDESHATLYNAILSVDAEGRTVDVLAVAGWLENVAQLDDVGGVHEVIDITAQTSDATRAVEWAELVVAFARKREAQHSD